MNTDIYIPGKLNFPSDHFPIVARLDDEKGIGIVSWNVLNENYKKYIHYDQGLTGSELDKMSEEQRYDSIINIINMAFNNNVGIFALQEVSNKLLARLLLLGMLVVSTPNMDSEGIDNGCILINTKLVMLDGINMTTSYIADDNTENNYIQQVYLYLTHDPAKKFIFINTHTLFKSIKQLIAHLKLIKEPFIVAGDFNVGLYDTRKDCSIKPLLEEKEFSLMLDHADYSHVNTFKRLDLFDHFYTHDLILVKDLKLLHVLRQDLKLC